jgi:hypothetical protein
MFFEGHILSAARDALITEALSMLYRTWMLLLTHFLSSWFCGFSNEFRKSFKEEHPDVKGVTMVSSWICFYGCFSEFQSLGLYYSLLAASQLICLFFPVYFSFDIIFQPVTACFPFGYRCVVAVCSADFLSRLAKLEEKSGKTWLMLWVSFPQCFLWVCCLSSQFLSAAR